MGRPMRPAGKSSLGRSLLHFVAKDMRTTKYRLKAYASRPWSGTPAPAPGLLDSDMRWEPVRPPTRRSAQESPRRGTHRVNPHPKRPHCCESAPPRIEFGDKWSHRHHTTTPASTRKESHLDYELSHRLRRAHVASKELAPPGASNFTHSVTNKNPILCMRQPATRSTWGSSHGDCAR